MKKLITTVVGALAVLTLAVAGPSVLPGAAPPAQASPLQGKYLQKCPLANVKQEDPLTNPGPPGTLSDHRHSEFGATNWGADSTLGSLLNSPTTCFLRDNRSAYWFPSWKLADGTYADANAFTPYYGTFGIDTRAIAGGVVHPFTGQRFIAGNPHSPVTQSPGVVKWRCLDGVNSGNTYNAPPLWCSSTLAGLLTFPQCWDGVQLDAPDHRSNMASTVNVTLPGGEVVKGCPASHPIALPQIQASVDYPLPAGKTWTGAFLDSDHGVGPAGRTFHGDTFEAQGPMQNEATKCLNDPARNTSGAPLCGTFTAAGLTMTDMLEDWASAFKYVDPDGTPGVFPS